MKKIFILLISLSVLALSSCIFSTNGTGKVYVSFKFHDNGYYVRLQTDDPNSLISASDSVLYNSGACSFVEKITFSSKCNKKESDIIDRDMTSYAGTIFKVYEIYDLYGSGITSNGETFELKIPNASDTDKHISFTYYFIKDDPSTFE